ncbi:MULTISPECIES: hypothetical protein [unclassified Streptomyces]|uniref:hypothetical protein n=1 Tax=unclassified Streptomyces TaxID=2593676 RepID=UPI002E2E4D68|nr:hypothetical protein [Streptomyces sp. NBC_01423]WSX89218.1 hypothetical protein OH827_01075 [Streptomyces sp. NBC_00891]WSY03697.1 hypothetical protein OG464_01075 [Streptomyces sp. NBC_00890]WSZ05323.1 hypothetical protein OG704_01075 [Streptomyces sp. NBC_00869]WSZ27181.1 hypothetical protein OG498_32490 [Streptomyces sp. NBC_00870]
MNPVLRGLAANPSMPSELIDRLIALADADIAEILACRPDLGHAQAVALAASVEESVPRLAYEGRLTAADIDPATQPEGALALLSEGHARSPEWARHFAGDPVAEHREKLAACPGLPDDVVEKLAADPDVQVVAELALWTTPRTAARLASHPHAAVRRALAANEATPPVVLAALLTGEGLPPVRRCLVCDREETPFVHDPHCPRLDCDLPPGASCDGSHESTRHDTQLAAVRNPATPTEAVVGFVDHPSLLLRWALAARPDLPPDVCARLAEDANPGVRGDLAENPAIDDALIRVLATDRDHEVRRRLAHNPRVPLDVLTRLAGTTRIGATLLPRIASTSPDEAEELAASPNPAARMLMAQRRDLAPSVRDALADDSDAKVVKSIAPHPGLTDSRLSAMLDRYGSQVAAKVAANPDATPALLETIARHGPAARKALREIARHRHATAPALLACLRDARARPIAAGHAALPQAVIEELLTDAEVAEAAAANPSLPPSVMSDLVSRP